MPAFPYIILENKLTLLPRPYKTTYGGEGGEAAAKQGFSPRGSNSDPGANTRPDTGVW